MELSIRSISLFLIKLLGKVVSRVEKSYVDKLTALKFLALCLSNTSPEF